MANRAARPKRKRGRAGGRARTARKPLAPEVGRSGGLRESRVCALLSAQASFTLLQQMPSLPTAGAVLSQDQIDFFRAHGYLLIERLLDETMLESLTDFL